MTDAAARVEAAEAKRAARKAALASQREEQFATDLEALDQLELEHGDGCLARLELERYAPGLPTFVVLKAPSGVQYKRFCDQLARAAKGDSAKARQDAQELLGKSCWVYPAAGAEQLAMLEVFPGLPLSLAIRAAQLVEAREAEAGKG